jgi:hypothetical protein
MLRVCYRCDRDIYPKEKIIFSDQFATQDKNGNWHCTDCLKEEANNDLIRRAPKSLAAKQIIAERKRKEEFKARYERMRKQPGERLAYYNDTGLRRYSQ